MTKEEVLQRANDYCNERSYDESTLTSEFKDKFADFFAKKNPDANIDDESVLADLKFNLDTARSASARGIALKSSNFEQQVTDYKTQIEELKKKIGKQQQQQQPPAIPQEVQDQLDELKKFKDSEAKKNKFNSIIAEAKKGIRADLHQSFETFANGTDVALDKDDKTQAEALVSRFQAIFKDSIGDIKPYTPRQVEQQDDEVIGSVKKITL